jgi:hypothetical protein
MSSTQTMNPVQQNYMARQAVLATGVRYNMKIAPVSSSGAGSFQIPLNRFGITTGITLRFTVVINNTGTTALTLSPTAPFSLVNQISYTDFGGLQHTSNAAGALLYVGEAVRTGKLPYAGSNVTNIPGLVQNSSILEIGGAVGESTTQFSIYVPLAVDPNSDLTGAVLSQTGQGNHYVTFSVAPNGVVGSDPLMNAFLAGTASVTSVTVQATQHVIQVQDYNMIPRIDLETVYGFQTQIDTDSIAAGLDHYCYWPNARRVFSAVHVFDNGGALNFGTDLNQIRVLVNTNTELDNYAPIDWLSQQRLKFDNLDLFPGFYYKGSRRYPIQISQIGQFATVFTPSSIGTAGPVQFVSQYEVQYPSGQPLPGLIAA